MATDQTQSVTQTSDGRFPAISAIAAAPFLLVARALINAKATETTIRYSVSSHCFNIIGDDSDEYLNGVRVAKLEEIPFSVWVWAAMTTAGLADGSFVLTTAVLIPLTISVYGISTVDVAINGEEVGDDA